MMGMRAAAGEGAAVGPVLAVVVVDVLVYALVLPLFPGILGQAVSDGDWLRLQSAGNLAAACAGSVVGWLSDELGRREVMAASQAAGVLCSLLLAFGALCGDPQRAALFLGLGFVLRKGNRTVPLACALITDLTDDPVLRKNRLRRLGSTFGLGFAAGPALAGWMSQVLSAWHLFLVGAALGLCNVVAVLLLPQFAAKHEHRAADGRSSGAQGLREVWDKCSQPGVYPVFLIHGMACMAQFMYITTIGMAARDRFKMDTAAYGSLMSFFGITYSLALLTVVPWLARLIPRDRHLLCFGLGLTALTRFVASAITSVPLLFLTHVFTSVGTACISFVITHVIAHTGKYAGITGSMVGIQDSVQRASGVLAPLVLSGLPQSAVRRVAGPVYVGAFVSGLAYLLALALALRADLHEVAAPQDVGAATTLLRAPPIRQKSE